MSALADRWTDSADPETLAVAALEAARCECGSNFRVGDECFICGREVRVLGTLSRDFRRAAYDRRLRWARRAGLDPGRGFKGLHAEVGANPELCELDAALTGRVGALAPPVEGDPFAEDIASLMVA